ncbi:class I SAM-dependent methyltransferase [Microbacterium sp. NC79]|uniref:class I SAM-dependent methyltransferase n=1 Tax=Microbacterium sp. NC79 TaxID=2851009 RepID=UPI001C2C0063|nr:class I SAM-dependent methyltransferase [Microbacterium sp. NC79]MBV0894455.1 class I SAM-dependent methyltransferase [Microbacterium sp. NC79]
MASLEEMSTSFGVASAAYDAGRPEYPAASVEFLLAPLDGVPTVADVGAGTGKLLRSILRVREAEAVAVDPDAAMLLKLDERTPGVDTRVGTAEHLPLDDASVDAVVLGQAWHWVDPVAGSREIGRVLRPGGVLGLIWNVRDERVAWVHDLTHILHASSAEEMIAAGEIRVNDPFGALEEHMLEWKREMNRADLQAMVRSRSYFITAAEADQNRMITEVNALLDRLGVVGEQTIAMPYVTKAFRATRP